MLKHFAVDFCWTPVSSTCRTSPFWNFKLFQSFRKHGEYFRVVVVDVRSALYVCWNTSTLNLNVYMRDFTLHVWNVWCTQILCWYEGGDILYLSYNLLPTVLKMRFFLKYTRLSSEVSPNLQRSVPNVIRPNPPIYHGLRLKLLKFVIFHLVVCKLSSPGPPMTSCRSWTYRKTILNLPMLKKWYDSETLSDGNWVVLFSSSAHDLSSFFGFIMFCLTHSSVNAPGVLV